MLFKKIFKKAATGKIVEWEIEVVDNKYRTITGQQGGKKITSAWTICSEKNTGKSNATTARQQAIKEAQALRTKKLEKDYKETTDSLDSLSYIKPMLAHEVELDTLTYPVYSQPKLDGIRCICNASSMKSRNGKHIFGAPHIRRTLFEFFKKNPTVTLDGELYSHRLKEDFNEIVSIVKKQNPTLQELVKSEEILEYWIYDIVDNETLFMDRSKFISMNIPDYPCLHIVSTTLVNTREELDLLYEQYRKEGFEGQIIRLNKLYQNKRTKYLLKRKEFKEEEFEVIDIVEGKGNRGETAGYVAAKTKNGNVFRANISGTMSELKKILKNKKKFKTATIKFFNYTPAGIPRFGVVKNFDRDIYE